MKRTFVLTIMCIYAQLALADFGWLPKHETLIVRIGGSFLSSTENFDSGGLREDISFQNQLVKFTENRLFSETEYAFSPGWSAQLDVGFGQSVVKPNPATSGALLAASGFGDIRLAVKRQFRKIAPVVTLETFLTFPTNSTSADIDELLPGNGAFELGLIGHTGIRMKSLFFSISPGFVFRSSGYSSAFLITAAVGGYLKPAYAMIFTNWYASLGDSLLNDSSLAVHDANGSGGSHMRLSGSPTNFGIGLKIGARLFQTYGLEIFYKQTTTGNRAPNYSMFGINFRGAFDFYKPDTRMKIREVPFDREDPVQKTEE